MKNFVYVLAALALVCGASAAEKEKTVFGTAFQGLAGDDQASFVREVNRSMAKSDEPMDAKRIETLYRVNRDAVKASPEADRKIVLAEVFATAPMVCLPRITEGFAKDLFNRKAAGFSEKDDSFTEFAAAALMRIRGRCLREGKWTFPGARTTFAVMMFLKASEGKPEDLRKHFIMFVPTGSFELARKEWIPAGMGDDNKPVSYQAILEAGKKGEEPDHVNGHPMGMPELGNLQVGSRFRTWDAKDVSSPTPLDIQHVPHAAVDNPRLPDGTDSPWYRRRRGYAPPDESRGYQGQVLH